MKEKIFKIFNSMDKELRQYFFNRFFLCAAILLFTVFISIFFRSLFLLPTVFLTIIIYFLWNCYILYKIDNGYITSLIGVCIKTNVSNIKVSSFEIFSKNEVSLSYNDMIYSFNIPSSINIKEGDYIKLYYDKTSVNERGGGYFLTNVLCYNLNP